MRIRILSSSDIRHLLTFPNVIATAREAFTTRADVPLRTAINSPDGVLLFMPGHIDGSDAVVEKIVSVYSQNPARGLPAVNGLVIVFDAKTGMPQALMDGATLTSIRTGAATALATDLLARKDSHVLAMIGAGGQAPDQVRGVCAVRDISEVRIFSRSGERSSEMASALRLEGVNAISVSTAREALIGADIVNCATTSHSPVFDDSDVKPGAHINAIGAYTPDMHEVPPATVARAYIVIDNTAAAQAEAGDLLIPLRLGLIDDNCFDRTLGKILSADSPSRTSPDQITLFKSVGIVTQDITAATLALSLAEKEGVGMIITI
jgi:ornithine cyclodeaminase